MSKMILPVHPEYAELILAKKKRFEFRKQNCRSGVGALLIYATSPVCAIVCETEISGVMQGTPEAIWQMAQDYAGISKEDYSRYYDGRSKAVAFKLGRIIKFDKPIMLATFGIRHAPQSFVYVK